MTWSRCDGSASSNVKVSVAIPSRPVRVDEATMWIPWSEIAVVTSRSSLARSSASMWMPTMNVPCCRSSHQTFAILP